jgi:hypothetical protein
MKILIKICLLILAFTLNACGGGGGGGSDSPKPTGKTTAILKISTKEAALSGVLFRGVGVTLTLPDGVTVATTADGTALPSVADPSGVADTGSVFPLVYTATTASTPAILNFVVNAGDSPFGIGEFVTVNLKLPNGNSLTVADFSTAIISNWTPSGLDLATVQGITPVITATLN